MRDLLLYAAGMLALLVAIVHGVLGETRVFKRAQIEPPSARRLVCLVWHCSAVAWATIAALLVFAPVMGSEAARHSIVAAAAVTFGFGAIANAWATRGRHFGWAAALLVTGLSIGGW
jgi:hypothetical protein